MKIMATARIIPTVVVNNLFLDTGIIKRVYKEEYKILLYEPLDIFFHEEHYSAIFPFILVLIFCELR